MKPSMFAIWMLCALPVIAVKHALAWYEQHGASLADPARGFCIPCGVSPPAHAAG